MKRDAVLISTIKARRTTRVWGEAQPWKEEDGCFLSSDKEGGCGSGSVVRNGEIEGTEAGVSFRTLNMAWKTGIRWGDSPLNTQSTRWSRVRRDTEFGGPISLESVVHTAASERGRSTASCHRAVLLGNEMPSWELIPEPIIQKRKKAIYIKVFCAKAVTGGNKDFGYKRSTNWHRTKSSKVREYSTTI